MSKSVKIFSLNYISKEQLTKVLPLMAMPNACNFPLDLQSWFFCKKNNLQCITPEDVIGPDEKANILHKAFELSRLFIDDFSQLYKIANISLWHLFSRRFFSLFCSLLMIEAISLKWKENNIHALLLNDLPIKEDFIEYSFLGASISFLDDIWGWQSPITSNKLPPSLKEKDKPLLSDASQIRGNYLLAVETSEIGRYEKLINGLTGDGLHVTPIVFPFDSDKYEDIYTAGEQANLQQLHIDIPQIATAKIFGTFHPDYPGKSRNPFFIKIWNCLSRTFAYYHYVYIPWLARYFRAWINVLQEIRPKAVFTSNVSYPISNLPRLAAEKLGIPSFGLQHSIIPERRFVESKQIWLTDRPYWSDFLNRKNIPSQLVHYKMPLVNIKRHVDSVQKENLSIKPTNSGKNAETINILILTAIFSDDTLFHAAANPNCTYKLLQKLGNIPHDIKDNVNIFIKWHPFFGDAGFWSICCKDSCLQLVDCKLNINDFLQSMDYVIALDYFTSGLLETMEHKVPVLAFLTPAWKAYTDIVYMAEQNCCSGFVESMHTLKDVDDLWSILRTHMREKTVSGEILRKATFYNQLRSMPGQGVELTDFLKRVGNTNNE